MTKKSLEPSLTKLANAAMKQAAKKVIERALNTGTPLIIWENGHVAKVTAQTKKRAANPPKPLE